MVESAVRLVDAVALALGDAAQARDLVARALAASGRSEVPSDPRVMLSFVRGYVVERLVELIGPRTALVFLDELRADLDEAVPERTEPRRPREPVEAPLRAPSLAPSAVPQVVVIDHNPYSRAELARALIRAGLTIVAGANAREEMSEGGSARVIVARIHRPTELAELATALRSSRATLLVLLVDAGDGDAVELSRTSAIRCELVPASSPATSVSALVLAHLGEPPRALGRTAG